VGKESLKVGRELGKTQQNTPAAVCDRGNVSWVGIVSLYGI